MSSGSVYSDTLHAITATKLEELTKHRETFEKQYKALLQKADAEPDALKRLHILVDGAKEILRIRTEPSHSEGGTRGRVVRFGGTQDHALETDLKNLDRFLEQVKYDPSVSPKALENWEALVRRYLAIPSAKYQYADLYGKLVTEWLTSEKTALTNDGGDVNMADSFEELPGVKKMESRTEWERMVFSPFNINTNNLKSYLTDLFLGGTTEEEKTKAKNLLGELRQSIRDSAEILSAPSQFSKENLRWTIESLEASDLLPNEKREALKDFLKDDIILNEIADVLNMRMKALDRWTWGDFVPLEQRRQLNGHYSIHMHEDLLQAIFLHYIGAQWSFFFKQAFNAFLSKKMSPNAHSNKKSLFDTNEKVDDIPRTDSLRRKYYLGPRGADTSPSLQSARVERYKNTYFAHQLLDYPGQKIEMQDGEQEADFQEFAVQQRDMHQPESRVTMSAQAPTQTFGSAATQLFGNAATQAPMGARLRIAPGRPAPHSAFGGSLFGDPSRQSQNAIPSIPFRDEDDGDGDSDVSARKPKKPMQAKQSLLHLLSTEIVINTHLHGELTCFRSVFDSWNPLLPHDTVLTVLEFLGVPTKWRAFFKKFLEAPLKFMDDPAAEPRARKRGTPGSHALSDVFGEVVLVCLDLSVRQATDGGMLHRVHDDIWFWSKDCKQCGEAWASVTKFTEVMGVKLNTEKTGTVRITSDTTNSAPIPSDTHLPAGEIRWGFLYLSHETGRFEIDAKMVSSHITSLSTQLSSKKSSIISWIQAWNTYATTFMSSNFGQAANCFGREHVDKMLATHRHIQSTLFGDAGGSVTQFLKNTIRERFGVDDIPDGFLLFPVELGGLDVQSPFIPLLQIRDAVKENPRDFLTDFDAAERADYASAKLAFERDGGYTDPPTTRGGSLFSPPPSSTLPSILDPTTFLPFSEYIRHRERCTALGTASLLRVYRDLLRRPEKANCIDVSVQVRQAMDELGAKPGLKGITGDWHAMEPYWKWVAQMYGPEMVERFGGLSVVDAELLPLGMVGMFRGKRVMWQG